VEDQVALVQREALERVSRAEAKNAIVLAFAHQDAEGPARKITLLEDEIAAEHRAWEVSKRERQEQFEELILLQTWGSELCHAIVGPPRARHHLSEGMRLAALCHIEMAGEPTALQAVVSTATELVLRCSPTDTFRVEVVSELATEF
jgi:7-keto-8-aminopelargonate synthetase-like enzyme